MNENKPKPETPEATPQPKPINEVLSAEMDALLNTPTVLDEPAPTITPTPAAAPVAETTPNPAVAPTPATTTKKSTWAIALASLFCTMLILFFIITGPGTYLSVIGANGFGWIVMLFLGYILLGSALIVPVFFITFAIALKQAKANLLDTYATVLAQSYLCMINCIVLWLCVQLEVFTSILALTMTCSVAISLAILAYITIRKNKKNPIIFKESTLSTIHSITTIVLYIFAGLSFVMPLILVFF